MDIEEAREYALSMKGVTESLFGGNSWISFSIEGKWFMLLQLDAPEPRVAVKLLPETGASLREQYAGVVAAYHMNKQHWNDLYLEQLSDDFVKNCIRESYNLVVNRLSKKLRAKYNEGTTT
ncbi:MAG: MmcQ/YjbR family DNA-binding protein [Muribaculaceae bacterium]|jgi:predicted DNA-binding protein (MmcQ/YjbR family)|nr:MmcQ/YjbR family DNA-binding protein [Muribaculaceae bacterium]